MYAIIEAPAKGWLDPVIFAAFGLVALLLASSVLRELRAREPLLNLCFFQNPRFTVALAAFMIPRRPRVTEALEAEPELAAALELAYEAEAA